MLLCLKRMVSVKYSSTMEPEERPIAGGHNSIYAPFYWLVGNVMASDEVIGRCAVTVVGPYLTSVPLDAYCPSALTRTSLPRLIHLSRIWRFLLRVSAPKPFSHARLPLPYVCIYSRSDGFISVVLVLLCIQVQFRARVNQGEAKVDYNHHTSDNINGGEDGIVVEAAGSDLETVLERSCKS